MSKVQRRKSTTIRRDTGNPRNSFNDGVRRGNDIIKAIKADPDYRGYDSDLTNNKRFNIVSDIYLTNLRILRSAIDTNNYNLAQYIRGQQSVLDNFLKITDLNRYNDFMR